MKPTFDAQTLCQLLDAQSERFLQAIHTLDAIEVTLKKDGWSDVVQAQLHGLNRELTSDATYGEAIRQWNALQQPASPQLQQAVERAKSTMHSLLERIDSMQAIASELKDRLVPRIDQAARKQTAMNAYRQAWQNDPTPRGESS